MLGSDPSVLVLVLEVGLQVAAAVAVEGLVGGQIRGRVAAGRRARRSGIVQWVVVRTLLGRLLCGVEGVLEVLGRVALTAVVNRVALGHLSDKATGQLQRGDLQPNLLGFASATTAVDAEQTDADDQHHGNSGHNAGDHCAIVGGGRGHNDGSG